MTPLERHIRSLIDQEGPITVERFMALCARHYYATRDPFGASGDFTTAPEISQMFGELVGLWSVAVWQAMGSPAALALVEFGPGRGTLMADALRAARLRPDYRSAAAVHLVETSPSLRSRQAATLASSGVPIRWHDDLATVPPGPTIVIANEFFDALPIRQFVATERGWCERLVALQDGRLAFGLSAEPRASLGPPSRPGGVLEFPEAAMAAVREVARRLAGCGGAALLIDYGSWEGGFNDTLQALNDHAFADPLSDPGEADLTAHVRFGRLAEAARSEGALVHGPATQGDFLRALGIEERAAALKRRAEPAQAAGVDAALHRLTAPGATGMGDLFKVLGLSDRSLAALPGLGPAARS